MAKTRQTIKGTHSGGNGAVVSGSSRAVSAFLAVSWTQDLVWKMLHSLEENPQIRHGIWPRERERSTGNTKIGCYEKLASLVFDGTIYGTYIERGKGGLRFYGNSMKAKCRKLLCQYKEVREEIGETGAGVTGEEEIDEGSTLANKWIEIKERCPYFFVLRNLLGERPNITEPARANSKTELELDALKRSIPDLKRSTPELKESQLQQLEPSFIEDIISLSDSINYAEEEQNLNGSEPEREEDEIKEEMEKASGTQSDVGKQDDSIHELTEKKGKSIIRTPHLKPDRGKLPLSNTRSSWTSEVKEIVNTLLSQPAASSQEKNQSKRPFHSSSYPKKHQKLTYEDERTEKDEKFDDHKEAWLELEREKLQVERERMRHERDMMILKFRLERGDQLADFDSM